MRIDVSTLLILGALAIPCGGHAFSQEPAVSRESPEARQQIERAVRNLGSGKFAEREAAMRFLWAQGRLAEAALRKAAAGTDPEVVSRARALLRDFDYGIFPDTPAETVERIRLFISGNAAQRQQIIGELQDRKQHRTAMRLIRKTEPAAARNALAEKFCEQVQSEASEQILQGQFEAARELLVLAAEVGDPGQVHALAAYVFATEDAERWLAEAESPFPMLAGARWRLFKIHLLRLMGRSQQAYDRAAELPAAERLQDDLLLTLALELGNWKAALAEVNQLRKTGSQNVGDILEWGGYAASLAGLSGDGETQRRELDALRQQAKQNEALSFYVAEALMCNNQFDAAIELLAEPIPSYAFRLHCAREDFRAAFRLLNCDNPQAPAETWSTPLLERMRSDKKQASQIRELLIFAGAQLHRMGRVEEAEALLGALVGEGSDDKGEEQERVLDTVRTALRFGLADRAFAVAAELLEADSVPPSLVFRALYSREPPSTVHLWWNFLGDYLPNAPVAERVATLRKLYFPTNTPPLSDPDRDKLLAAARAYAPRPLESGDGKGETKQAEERDDELLRSEWLYYVSEMAERHRRPKLRLECLDDAAPQYLPAALARGDLAREAEDFASATRWYRQATEMNPRDPIARYLLALTQQRTGADEEATRNRRIANAFYLNRDDRRALADALRSRGLMDEASYHWTLGWRSASFRDPSVGNSVYNLALHWKKTRPEQAAAQLTRYLLGVLRTSNRFTAIESHLRLVVLRHEARTWHALATRDVAAAQQELREALLVMPGNLDLIRLMVPELDQLGFAKEADRLFQNAWDLHEEICELFPTSALYRNNLAWSAALCDRKLGEAMPLAKQAVALQPDNANYLDTLAEIHFRQGDQQTAVRLSQKTLEMQPASATFPRQLHRFQNNIRELADEDR